MTADLAGHIGIALFAVLVVSAFSMGVIAPFNRSAALAVVAVSIATAVASFVLPA